jgi:hypothetical protein
MLQKVIRALRFVVRRDRRRTEMPATNGVGMIQPI